MFELLITQFEDMRDGINFDDDQIDKKPRQKIYSELCWGLYATTNPIQAVLAQELREDA